MDADVIQKIKDWINTLDGDALTGAFDALNDIIMARSAGGDGFVPPELPIDPELERPTIEEPPFIDPDLEIEDPDHVLDDDKSDDGSDMDSDGDSDDSDSDDEDGDGKESEDSDKSEGDKDDEDGDGTDGDGEDEDKDKGSKKGKSGKDSDDPEKGKSGKSPKGDHDGNAGGSGDGETDDIDDMDDDDSEDDTDSDEDVKKDSEGEAGDGEGDSKGDTEDDEEVDDAAGVDKALIDDDATAEKKKEEIFRRKVETAGAKKLIRRIKKRLEDGKGELSDEDKGTLDITEKALDKVAKDLAEDGEEAIKKMTPEEFKSLIDKAYDLADKVGIKSTTIKDIKSRVEKMTSDLEDEMTADEIATEDDFNKISDPEFKKMKAKEDEKKRLEKEIEDSWARSFDGNMEDFKKDLIRAVTEQIDDMIEQEEDTYAYPSRLHGDDDVTVPAVRIEDIPENKKPSIDVYFDQSGSWSSRDVDRGKAAIKALLDLKKEGLLNLEIYFFSAILTQNAEAARARGEVECWDMIVDNINSAPKTKNVIIMTDTDIEIDWGRPGCHGVVNGPKTIVDGCVWWLWKGGRRVARARVALKGKKGTFEYTV